VPILVTGGAGYIGSHTCVELIKSGYEVVVLDNLSNSKPEVLNRIAEVSGQSVRFYQGDVLHKPMLRQVFSAHSIDAVVHFAGVKAVGESVEKPLKYYQNNVVGTLTLLEVMHEFGVKRIVFSSSATVYGDPHEVPIKEDFPLGPVNPYGRSKLMVEDILRDQCTADPNFGACLLRYFNPIGAHASGRMGEDPSGIPNNLMPFVTQVAVGKRPLLQVFGNDYDTPDGTGVRDYIHVVDLALGHVKALMWQQASRGIGVFNLGTGTGVSVLELINAFALATGAEVPYAFAPRREGDVAKCYADAKKAKNELHWQAERGLLAMCQDAWRWQKNNPQGY